LKTITLNRKGDFRINAVGDSKCASTHQMLFRYEARIRVPYTEDTLDDNGFLVDQHEVNGWVRGATRGFNGSCERAAVLITESIAYALDQKNIYWNKVSVRVSVDAGSAFITFELERANPKSDE
jgi:hypothetical protein